MAKYSANLPQLSGDLFLTDGGIETTMIFHEDLTLPHFAAFHLRNDIKGQDTFKKYFHCHRTIAKKYKVGFILETVTWRTNLDRVIKLGYSTAELDQAEESDEVDTIELS